MDDDIQPLSARDIAPRLIEQFGYRPASARRVAEQLVSTDPDIRAAFGRWWRTGALEPSVEVAGYTVARLIAEFRLHPVAAFSTLHGLRADPRRTLDTLRRGFDRRTIPIRQPDR